MIEYFDERTYAPAVDGFPVTKIFCKHNILILLSKIIRYFLSKTLITQLLSTRIGLHCCAVFVPARSDDAFQPEKV